MKIIDKTPFRQEDGSITLMDQIQATFKFGLNWHKRIQAQDKIIPTLEKHLGRNFILMRNVTLGGTEVELPMILIGPPGVLLVNVIFEQGVFRAKEDEWGSISGDQFVPAKVNLVGLTARMGKFLQIFLDRAGLKGMLNVESVMLSAEAGTHIESVRPIVRVVMSDALERFAISLSQARAALSPEMSAAIAQVILTGKPIGKAVEAPQPEPEPEPIAAYNLYEQEDTRETGGDGSLGEFTFQDDEPEENDEPKPTQKAKGLKTKTGRKKKQRIMGLTVPQLAILGGILLVWLCAVIGFLIFISSQ